MLHMDGLLGPGILHNLVGSVELPPGTTRHAVEQALDRLGERNPALTATLTGDLPGKNQRTGQQAIEVQTATGASPEDAGSLTARLRHLRLDRSTQARAVAELGETGGGGRLVLAVDHLVCDAAARELVVRDLTALLTTGAFAADPRPRPPDYRTYCLEQARALSEERTRLREIERWKRALDGCRPLPRLTTGGPDDGPLAAWCWEITEAGPALHSTIRGLARTTATSPFVVGAALYAVAIWSRTGIRSSALVTPVSTRRAPEHERLISNLVNERLVPYRVVPERDFTALAQSIGTSFLSALRSSSLAIPDLVAAVDGYRELLQTPGCAYVQLQVSASEGTEPVPPAGQRTWPWGVPYAPPTGITCTVFRVNTSPAGARLSAFHGGPAGQGAAVAALMKDVVRLATSVACDPGAPIGRLAAALS
ncbi:hypothetical protein DMA12_01685 [Amycolatopsis balhimycina DSM 5908]|uniref:Condensation domain-containing protein n=2 Tax=Amycolatopsis balhimycina TaxID=208443 RepID=A0A428X6D4_AMYBA|nr:hypothetical protein DMA12_01685 [Amycolatopsis balhimycina DSM 5908]